MFVYLCVTINQKAEYYIPGTFNLLCRLDLKLDQHQDNCIVTWLRRNGSE